MLPYISVFLDNIGFLQILLIFLASLRMNLGESGFTMNSSAFKIQSKSQFHAVLPYLDKLGIHSLWEYKGRPMGGPLLAERSLAPSIVSNVD